MRPENEDPTFASGYRAGQADLMRDLKKQVFSIKKARAHVEDQTDELARILTDPTRLIELAGDNPEIDKALTTAVLAMLMANGGVTPDDLST